MSTNRFLLVDFISPQGVRGLVTNVHKVAHNISQIPEFEKKIIERLQQKSDFSMITVFGRWILVYQANSINDNDTMMHVIDFRIDMSANSNQEIFSANTLRNIWQLQERYVKVFEDKYDTVELSYAESTEQIIKPNFFGCESNSVVLQKARELGVLPAIESDPGQGRIKVVLADEKVTRDGELLTHVYAFMHFTGEDGGFAYLKIYDLVRNFDRTDDLQQGIEEAGGNFDRIYLMEKFNNAKLN
jgi:hypothetical protein